MVLDRHSDPVRFWISTWPDLHLDQARIAFLDHEGRMTLSTLLESMVDEEPRRQCSRQFVIYYPEKDLGMHE